MEHPEKLIVCDCDGVLLDWEYAFDCYANSHGFYKNPDVPPAFHLASAYEVDSETMLDMVVRFNESAAIGFLPSVRDAQHWVKKLGVEGYRFHVISSISKDPCVRELRIRNLEKLFGKIFDHVECLPIASSKLEYLERNFKDSGLLWIEDHVANAEAGASVGMRALIMAQGYNRSYQGPIPKVMNWAEIYNIATK